MNPQATDTLNRAGIALAGLLVFAVICRVRGLGRRELALVAFPLRTAAAWLALTVALVFIDFQLERFGIGVPRPWTDDGWTLALRVALSCSIAPLLEELIFRGALYHHTERRIGPRAAVLLPALIFALLHVQYGGIELGLVFVHGCIYGLARRSSGSVLVPFLMHALGNSFSALERIVDLSPYRS